MKTLLSLSLLFSLMSCSSGPFKGDKFVPPPATIEEAVNSNFRTPENQKRDVYRHPIETLTFFGLKPEMSVIEIWPSGGWYTEILAPYLSSKGTYIIADPATDPKGYTNPRKEWFENNPSVRSLSVTFQPGENIALGTDNSVDMVLTFRNVHNWLPATNQQAAFDSFFKVLKPGGVLGVVEHRASTKVKFDPESGYVKEKDVIKMAKKAGFILVAKSEINANPKDKANYPDGVWTLPPRLKLGEVDKEKYLAIGESDRMTLKFAKPK